MSNSTGWEIIDIEIYTTGVFESKWTFSFTSIEQAYIIEDMFSFSMTGKISFHDRIGVSEIGPLTGEEKVKIKYGNTDGDGKYKEYTFHILEIQRFERNITLNPAGNDLITLILVDEYYHKWHSHFWSKSWKDTKIGDIIKDISENHLGITVFNEFESTKEKIEYFDTHQRTPAECITWLMNRASGSISGQPGYLYWMSGVADSTEFKHSFVTIEKMLAKTGWMKPYVETSGLYSDGNGIGSYIFDGKNPDFINKIRDHEVRNVDLSSLKTLTGGKALGYDSKRKKLIKQEYTYQDALSRYTLLGKFSLFPSSLEISKPVIIIDGCHDEKILDNIWYGNWIKEYSNQLLVSITVDGHVDRHAGGMIRIIWPSHAEKDSVSGLWTPKEEEFNKQLDGRYMVKSITHYFDKNQSYGWQQKLVCIKNGYKDTFNKNLIPASKKNL